MILLECIVPLNCQILDLAILVVEGLQDPVYCSGSCVIVAVQKVRLANTEQVEEIIQGHESIVGVRIVKLGK